MFKKWKALFKKRNKATGCENKRLSPTDRMLILYTLVPSKYAMVIMAKID